MTKKAFIPFIGAFVLLASCTENEMLDNSNPSSDAISFGTYVGPNSRASVMDLSALKGDNGGFKVFAAYTAGSTWADVTDKTPNFMYNDAVTWNSSTNRWEYQGMKYWPEAGNVTFYAYAPKGSTHITPSASTVTTAPTFSYTVPNEVGNQEDLLADIKPDQTKANGTVQFAFNHLLSKIGFSGKLAGEYAGATITVTKLKVTYGTDAIKNKATYTYAADESSTGAWSNASGVMSGENELQPTDGTMLSTEASALNADDKFLMLLPQATSAAALQAEIDYNVSYQDGTSIDNVAKVDLPACTWEQGKQYTYGFTLSMTEVIFDGIAVNPWMDGESVSVTDAKGNVVTTTATAILDATTGSANKAIFNISGVNPGKAPVITNGNPNYFTGEYKTTSRAVGESGTLTFSPNSTNEGTTSRQETITVTFEDALGNKKTYTFTLTQNPPLNLAQNSTAIESGKDLLFKSVKDVYSFNSNTTNASATFTAIGTKATDGINVTLSSSSDFAYSVVDGSTITFSAKNTLNAGDADKSATATVTLTGEEASNTKTYTINLKQAAPAVLMANEMVVAPGSTIDWKFKSTKEVVGNSSYTIEKAKSVTGGSLSSNDDFDITLNNSSLAITARNQLTGTGLTNKILNGTVILTNSCDETVTYTFNITQYAPAYITDSDGNIPGARRYQWKGLNPDSSTKTFYIQNGSVNSLSDWINSYKYLASHNITDVMQAPNIAEDKKSFGLYNKKIPFTTYAYCQGYITATVENPLGETFSYDILVERHG